MSVKVVAGVDLGGTAVNYTLITGEEKFLIEGLCEHPARSKEGPEICLQQIEDGLKIAVGQAGLDLDDVVVVGLNSDASVRAIKGPERPINGQYDRAAVLSGLETVDFITIFDDPSVLGLVKKVKPDVLIKGADWGSKEGVVGSDFVESYGGKVMLAPLVQGKSSTATIERIKTLEASES